ncbi:MAG: PPK2 family polyphosphate kinase [Gemmatimonadota bacterium]
MPTLKPLISPSSVSLTDDDARPPGSVPKGEAADLALVPLLEELTMWQAKLGAEEKRALLVVLQGRDASGKDGVIRKIFGPLNSATCVVSSFKRPSLLELQHDFLWRVHHVVPPAGTVGVFNRSHYEDVLVVRVHSLVPEKLWRKRYRHINEFERLLTDHGVTILKFFLHISTEEQQERLEARLADPTKNWKFELGDLAERALWGKYTEAYEEALTECSTEHAPWYLVPADKKGPRDVMIAEVLVDALEKMKPEFPPADPEILKLKGTIT